MLKRLGALVLLTMAINGLVTVKIWSEPQVVSSLSSVSPPTIGFMAPMDSLDPNEIFKAINQIRRDAKIPPLRVNKALEQIAQARAADMVKNQYYAHKSPDGKYYYDLLTAKSIDPTYSCENLDMTFVFDSQSVVKDWLSSATGHRECMLNPDVVEAGYATATLTVVDFNGKATTEYLVVAVHTTPL